MSSRNEAEAQVRSWGFGHVFTWTDGPGELTITYPEDEDSKKETFGPGARIDVGAKKLHEVWMGRVGCTYVIGE
ncbi:hypothetical protein GRF29_77g1379067 [Pseudopithomyces chartarum]|uniref:Uncharacterized protein n=1 Tax=Pseudopithomyces chartarum TaxID=1892770 RepID=A0AAN6LVX0_9PLEO|nr:hypothetical protein GRF29_77g1379067 [Pseudopithomyces chartarum]